MIGAIVFYLSDCLLFVFRDLFFSWSVHYPALSPFRLSLFLTVLSYGFSCLWSFAVARASSLLPAPLVLVFYQRSLFFYRLLPLLFIACHYHLIFFCFCCSFFVCCYQCVLVLIFCVHNPSHGYVVEFRASLRLF